jgi:molybdate transport system ATP-binding protein
MTGIQARFQLDWPSFQLDVDLDLPSHGITAFFGSSGSGKTTLLRCIAGLERAAGQLIVNGEVWQDERRFLATHKRALGYVFQEASLFAHLSVLGNLRYGLKRIPAKQQVNLEQAIELLGIGHLLERKPERLSGGERSRVGIARALALSPDILLMDEPLAALDVQRKQEILPYLERLHEALRIPVLYISHSPDEVARLADHLVVMENGRVLASGPLTETLTRLDLPIHLGEDAGAILEVSVAELDPEWHLARVVFSGGSLWARDQGLPIGCKLRVRVLARDVSLATEPPSKSSIQNILQGRVDALSDDEHPGLLLVRVQVGDAIILARLTKKSAVALDIRPGQQVWAQIKSVALME